MSGLFISKELREVRDNIRRTEDDIINISKQIYEILESDLLKAQHQKGEDYITYTVDRKIGKTHNLIKLAVEYKYPLIVHDASWARALQRSVKKECGENISILSYRSAGNIMDGIPCDIILKDEMVPIETLRDILNSSGKGYVNVVGIN